MGAGEGEGALIALLTPSVGDLSLTGLELGACPPEVLWHSANLRTLDLAHNALTMLPDALSGCCHLERLNLERNKLAVIPDAVFTLTSLRILQVSDNHVDTLPARISQLAALRMLLVGSNQLRCLCPSISCAPPTRIRFLRRPCGFMKSASVQHCQTCSCGVQRCIS